MRYETPPPWPARTDGLASSLQRVDPTRDPRPVSNWSDGYDWRFFTFTGVARANRLLLFLASPGDLYIDDMSLTDQSSPVLTPTNHLLNGNFEGPLTTNMGGPWIFSGAAVTNSSISTTFKRSGKSSLHLVFTERGGPTVNISQVIDSLVVSNTYTFSFWYRPTTNSSQLFTRLNTGFQPRISNLQPVPATPGLPNSTSLALPQFPSVWLNEIKTGETGGLTDVHGEPDPWIELYNEGSTTVDLSGLYLANNYSNLTQWAFPSNSIIQPGELKIVFADNEPHQSTEAEHHTNFRLNQTSGAIALSRLVDGHPQIIDYFNYPQLDPTASYGNYPDGQPFDRQIFDQPTPNISNEGTPASPAILINEWMASNTRTLLNIANENRTDDWFELYNSTSTSISLDGYHLSDDLQNPTKFQVPDDYQIPAHGYLLVWADGAPELNKVTDPALHAAFQLARGGEAIGLFGPNGLLVDSVTFGPQSSDISAGRFPDGDLQFPALSSPTPLAANAPPPNRSPPTLLPPSGQQPGEFQFNALANQSYTIQWKESLDQGRWHQLSNLAAEPNARTVAIQDPYPAANGRLYRVVTPQQPPQQGGPLILRSPRSKVRNQGDATQLSVLAVGTGPLTYQWFFEDTLIPTETGSTLTLPSLQLAQSGHYTVIVADQAGTATNTPPAILTLRPRILEEPEDVVAQTGESVEFTVNAVGLTPLHYVWTVDGAKFPETTSRTLILNNVQPFHSGTYRVNVSHITPIGKVGTRSREVTLTVR
jgi:hypothetical protein